MDTKEEAKVVEITPAMEKAGLRELHEVGLTDPVYLVRSIYMAMEYERLDSAGEL